MEKVVKKLNSPFAFNGCPSKPEKLKDTDYLSIKILDKVVKTGDGDYDFVIEKDVVFDKTPIQEVVDTDKESVGVANVIKQFMRTGDENLIPRDDGKHSVDLIGAPENLMELNEIGLKAEKDFKKLPDELVKGLDMKTFVENMNQEQFNAFVKAVADRSSQKKVEEKKDGE